MCQIIYERKKKRRDKTILKDENDYVDFLDMLLKTQVQKGFSL